jgi:hypothetical protein
MDMDTDDTQAWPFNMGDGPVWPEGKPWPCNIIAIGSGPEPLYYSQPISPQMRDDPPMLEAMAERARVGLAAVYAEHGRNLDAEGGVRQVAIPAVEIPGSIRNAVGLVDLSQYEPEGP